MSSVHHNQSIYYNTGSAAEPVLLPTVSLFTLQGVASDHSQASFSLLRPSGQAIEHLKSDGFRAMQSHLLLPTQPQAFIKNNFICTQAAFVSVTNLGRKVGAWKQQGYQCATIIMGHGNESIEQALLIAKHITTTSRQLRFPLFLELHRGSVTQSIETTLQMIEAYPTLCFTADFSHWIMSYRIDEMPPNQRLALLDKLDAVMNRCGFIQLRYASSDHIQLSNDQISDHSKAVYHQLISRVILAFQKQAKAGDVLFLAAEILPSFTGYSQLQYKQGHGLEFYHRYEEAHHILKTVLQLTGDKSAIAKYESGSFRMRHRHCVTNISELERLVSLQAENVIVELGMKQPCDDEQAVLLSAFYQLQRQYPHILLAIKRNTITHSIDDTLDILKAYPEIRLSVDLKEWLLGDEITVNKLYAFYRKLKRLKHNTHHTEETISTAEHVIAKRFIFMPQLLMSPAYHIEIIYRCFYYGIKKRLLLKAS